MLKTPASFVLAALGGSTYRNVRLAPSLAAAALDDRFDHPRPLCPARRDSSTLSDGQTTTVPVKSVLGEDFGDDAGPHRAPAFSHRKP